MTRERKEKRKQPNKQNIKEATVETFLKLMVMTKLGMSDILFEVMPSLIIFLKFTRTKNTFTGWVGYSQPLLTWLATSTRALEFSFLAKTDWPPPETAERLLIPKTLKATKMIWITLQHQKMVHLSAYATLWGRNFPS